MNPVLVEVIRGEVVESFHRGIICIVDENGKVIFSLGDIEQLCYPRSAMKYFQHIPMLASGAFDSLNLTLKDLAIMCGSHNGEDIHKTQVESILKGSSLSLNALQCGAQAPTLKKDLYALIRNNENPSSIHNNCSGKHAGFLAYCQFKGWEVDSYISLEHPMQKEIKHIVSKFYEVPEEDLKCGIDGCSAPIFGMSVRSQAIAYKNLISNNFEESLQLSCRRIVEAVTQYPEMVAGTQRYCTDLMRVTNGRIIGKTGADGVYCLAIPEKKWGISIKLDDGKMGPQYQIAQDLLQKLNLISQEEANQLNPYKEFDITNFAGRKVGISRTSNIDIPVNLA